MTNRKAVFIGRSTIDRTYLLDLFPEEDSKVFAQDYILQYGGPALNAATTFNLLGGRAILITCIGTNSGMIRVKEDLKTTFGLEIMDQANCDDYTIPESSIFVNSHTGTRTIINSPRKDDNCCKNDFDGNLTDVSTILLDGFLFNNRLKEEILTARKSGVKVIFDGGSWKENSSELLDVVDIAICSSRFLVPNLDKGETVEYMLKKGVETVAFTNNEKDIELYSGSGDPVKNIPVPQVNAIDTLGAGDVLHGAFCYFLGTGSDVKEALEKAAEIASKSCCYLGTHTWREK